MQNKIKLTILLFIIVLFLPIMVMSQDKRINMIVLIDDEICISLEEFKINTLNPITAKYRVGNLNLSNSEFDYIMSNTEENINIDLTKSVLSKDKIYFKNVNYKLNLQKVYLKQEYVIINIFNMDNKKYRKKYSKLIKDNKKYYVIVETPNSIKFD